VLREDDDTHYVWIFRGLYLGIHILIYSDSICNFSLNNTGDTEIGTFAQEISLVLLILVLDLMIYILQRILIGRKTVVFYTFRRTPTESRFRDFVCINDSEPNQNKGKQQEAQNNQRHDHMFHKPITNCKSYDITYNHSFFVLKTSSFRN
jgi:hypothetical protein